MYGKRITRLITVLEEHGYVQRCPVPGDARASTLAKNWLACEVLIAPLANEAGQMQSLFWVFAAWRAE